MNDDTEERAGLPGPAPDGGHTESIPIRWIVRQPVTAEIGDVAKVLRLVADLLDPLESAYVDSIGVNRSDQELTVTITFDRARMLLDPGWLRPDVVASYDGSDPLGNDKEFMIAIASELRAQQVVDVGCGTGVLARALAERGHTVEAVDPSPAMIAHARAQPGGEHVHWGVGDAASVRARAVDLVVMTGNVVQQILGDEWLHSLRAIYEALRANGHFVFSTRNPAAQEWERWAEIYGTESVDWDGTHVRATWLEPFGEHGGTLEALDDRYRFRSLEELRSSLTETGFAIDAVFGDWDRSDFGPESANIIVVARRL
jgi:SAM-dependent methyltransferase